MSALSFEGRWNDGERAKSTPVIVAFEAEGLAVKDADSVQAAFWAFEDLSPAAPIRSTSADALLRNPKASRATLFVQGPGVGALLAERAPQTTTSASRFKILRRSLVFTLAVGILAGVLLFGHFSASKAVANWIPQSTADEIGARSIGMFGPIAPECENQQGNIALQRILDRLQTGGDYGRPFKLHVARASVPNAFALPGRHIVLLSTLVKQARSAEEVAGVIAHEMGHGLEKDPEALFVRSVSMQALVQLLTGESGNQTALTFGAILLQLRYSRDAERLADAHAIEILKAARIDAKPTAEFFLRNASGGADDESSMSYLSTHPSSLERAKLFTSQPDYPGESVLSEKEWADAQAICEAVEAKPPKAEQKKVGKPKTRKA